MSAKALTDRTETSVETNWSKGSDWWVQLGMLQRLLRRSVLESGFLRLLVKQRCSCALHSVGCLDTTQPADMIRNRAQMKRVLCVAEKNDAAKGISDIMSNGRFRRVTLSNFLPLCVVCTITWLYMSTSCQLSVSSFFWLFCCHLFCFREKGCQSLIRSTSMNTICLVRYVHE